ncbi:hypothetical protein P3X46_025063 [Hevea brasiliensis]|uniref:DUF8040 domain-containing protein n=1 Tax=Hevea brasiliensis TaxID=3981 RepID=A0ABQ9L664_HEVBR|nr:hypothetical protein P3X46_025063 [Hevea brasiliensis]
MLFFLDMDIDVQTNNNDKKEEALNALNDDETWQLVIATASAITKYFYKCIYKEPCMVSYQTGLKWLLEVLQGHRDHCINMFRMDKNTMTQLCFRLESKYGLKSSRRIFQHFGKTISRVFRQVLHVVCLILMDIIKPIDPKFSDTLSEILNNRRCMPHFKDCIDVIDGTHVWASIALEEQIPYIGRKGITTQNIMAVCSFDMQFTFVYYLIDAGYPNMKGYLKPYKDAINHLPDFKHGQPSSGQEENFNCAHFSLRIQMEIIVASMALHNYIRRRARVDRVFQIFDRNPEYVLFNTLPDVEGIPIDSHKTMNHRI